MYNDEEEDGRSGIAESGRGLDLGVKQTEGAKQTARRKSQLKDYVHDEELYKTILHSFPEFKAKMMTTHPFPTTEIIRAEARNSFNDACIDRGVQFDFEDGIIEVVILHSGYIHILLISIS